MLAKGFVHIVYKEQRINDKKKHNKTDHTLCWLLSAHSGGGTISQPSDWEQMARNVMITKSRRLK